MIMVYFLHAAFDEEEKLRSVIELLNPDVDVEAAVDQIDEKMEYYSGHLDITRTMNAEEIESTIHFWGLNDTKEKIQEHNERIEAMLDESTAGTYYLTEGALRDILYEMGYKHGRINKEISQTAVEFSVESADEDFARAFSYLIPYEELLPKIKKAKAERIERIRIRTEESWRFY